jgi:hypothetical protein
MELYDWLVSHKSVRGNLKNKNGAWLAESASPVAFNPDTRVVTLQDGSKYMLPVKTACKAKEVHIKAEKLLKSLPVAYNGSSVEFQSADFFGQVLDDNQLPLEKGKIAAS